jgi:hypothetical protein
MDSAAKKSYEKPNMEWKLIKYHWDYPAKWFHLPTQSGEHHKRNNGNSSEM